MKMNKNDEVRIDIVTIVPYTILRIIVGEGDRMNFMFPVFDGVIAQI